MTRDEAIEAIRNNWPDERYSMLREALDVALAALSTPPVGEAERLREALEMIAGQRQCIDNLMSDKDIARAALASPVVVTVWLTDTPTASLSPQLLGVETSANNDAASPIGRCPQCHRAANDGPAPCGHEWHRAPAPVEPPPAAPSYKE